MRTVILITGTPVSRNPRARYFIYRIHVNTRTFQLQ